jgi:hypothetical protein
MAKESSTEVLLYVKSRRVVTSFYRASAAQLEATDPGALQSSTAIASRPSEGIAEDERGYMLPDEQARCVALVEEVALRRGYRLKIIDVTRANIVSKLLDTHLAGVEEYPVMVVESTGQRLVGPKAFTELSVLGHLPAEMQNRRAFTYLKVVTTDLDAIRSQLLTLEEVKEVHVITGDWDLFLVLEFPKSSGYTKRQMLDFIINLKRRVPSISDTSSFIPEVSVTKFPL